MNLFDIPSKRFAKTLRKDGDFDESKHPRDERGRFSSSGGGGGGSKPKSSSLFGPTTALLMAGLLAGGAVGLRNYRHLLPELNTLYQGGRQRLARTAVRNPILGTMAAAVNNARREGGAGVKRTGTIIGDSLTRGTLGGTRAFGPHERFGANAMRAASGRYSVAAQARRGRGPRGRGRKPKAERSYFSFN